MLERGTVKKKIIEILDQRNKKGLETYGETIDECDPPTGNWRQEVIEEVVDALQYSVRQLCETEKLVEIQDNKNTYLTHMMRKLTAVIEKDGLRRPCWCSMMGCERCDGTGWRLKDDAIDRASKKEYPMSDEEIAIAEGLCKDLANGAEDLEPIKSLEKVIKELEDKIELLEDDISCMHASGRTSFRRCTRCKSLHDVGYVCHCGHDNSMIDRE